MTFGYTIKRDGEEIACEVEGDMEWSREEWGTDGEFIGSVTADGVDISDDITGEEWIEINGMAMANENAISIDEDMHVSRCAFK